MRLFYISLLLLVFSGVSAQCDDEDFLDDCAEKLGESTFLKAYKVNASELNGDEKEFSYVFSKGTDYKLTVCNNSASEGNMVITLYDRNRKMVASSYDKRNKKFYPGIAYNCTATGVYYLVYSFVGASDNTCGVSILGFKK